jgi:hypothetical protein
MSPPAPPVPGGTSRGNAPADTLAAGIQAARQDALEQTLPVASAVAVRPPVCANACTAPGNVSESMTDPAARQVAPGRNAASETRAAGFRQTLRDRRDRWRMGMPIANR